MDDSTTRFGTVDPAANWRAADHQLSSFRRTLPSADLNDPELISFLDGLRQDILHGSGLAIVDGFPVSDLTTEQTEQLFWGVGLHLGRPVSQSVMGERLGHIIDVTKTDPNARAYRNKSELTPHTDPADMLTFLCIHPAARGGVSRFCSSMAIHEEIRRTRPDLLERLYRGYRYHRLGEEQPGDAPMTPHRVPVFSSHEGVTSCRYVRQYIEVAADEDPDTELEAADIEAFDLLESLAADPSFHFEFTLQAGEAVFANNFTVFHARSSFENDPELPPRHLLRLWLSADPPRPIASDVLHYDGEPGIQPVPGRTPSYATDVDVQ